MSARKGVVGFGKQSALGTPLAAPTFTVPIMGGGMRPVRPRDDLSITAATNARRGQHIKSAYGEGTVRMLAHTEAIGLLFYEAMGAQTVSGAGPFIHTFTMADALPALPLTVWSMVEDDWYRFTDTYVRRLMISGAATENCVVEVDFVSLDYDRVAAPTYTEVAPQPRYKFIGSTIQLEADNDTPTTISNIRSIEFEIDRVAELIYSTGLNPAFVVPERQVNLRAETIFRDAATDQGWDFLTGSSLGSIAATGGPTQDLLSGSAKATFGRHPIDATKTLIIATGSAVDSPVANWDYDVERPEADPGGGPVTIPIEGILRYPDTGTSELTVELKNDTALVY